MEGYATLCKENFEQKVMLLQGIKEGLFGSYDKAIAILESAVDVAQSHDLLNDKALILEYIFRLQLHHNKSPNALIRAQEAWQAIGASAKVDYLATVS